MHIMDNLPRYDAAYVYAAHMDDLPNDGAGPVRLYEDRTVAAKAAGTTNGLVPCAVVRYRDETLMTDKIVYRWLFVKGGVAVTGATDWYRSEIDADKECHVEICKRRMLFDSVVRQVGIIA